MRKLAKETCEHLLMVTLAQMNKETILFVDSTDIIWALLRFFRINQLCTQR